MKMARPMGPSARAVLDALASGPLSMAALSASTALTITELRHVCYRLCVSGRIVMLDSRRNDRCRRPVARYALPQAAMRADYVDLAGVWR